MGTLTSSFLTSGLGCRSSLLAWAVTCCRALRTDAMSSAASGGERPFRDTHAHTRAHTHARTHTHWHTHTRTFLLDLEQSGVQHAGHQVLRQIRGFLLRQVMQYLHTHTHTHTPSSHLLHTTNWLESLHWTKKQNKDIFPVDCVPKCP